MYWLPLHPNYAKFRSAFYVFNLHIPTYLLHSWLDCLVRIRFMLAILFGRCHVSLAWQLQSRIAMSNLYLLTLRLTWKVMTLTVSCSTPHSLPQTSIKILLTSDTPPKLGLQLFFQFMSAFSLVVASIFTIRCFAVGWIVSLGYYHC